MKSVESSIHIHVSFTENSQILRCSDVFQLLHTKNRKIEQSSLFRASLIGKFQFLILPVLNLIFFPFWIKTRRWTIQFSHYMVFQALGEIFTRLLKPQKLTYSEAFFGKKR